MKNKFFVVSILIGAGALFLTLFLFNMPVQKISEKTEAPKFDMSSMVRMNNHSYGNPSAKVVVVEFFDPECESCSAIHPTIKKLIKEYGDRIWFVHRYMPFHKNSRLAAAALEEARELGKYDIALDILFQRQSIWGDHRNPRPELIAKYLQEIGIPQAKTENDYLLKKHLEKINQDEVDGRALGVRGTPTFFINGRVLEQLGEPQLRSAIDSELQNK